MFLRALTPQRESGVDKTPGFLLLGPRQTGKSTLIENHLALVGGKKLVFRLQDTNTFHAVSKKPALIDEAVVAAVAHSDAVHLFIDEIQLVPELFGLWQTLLKSYPGRLRAYVSASSTRKLRHHEGGAPDFDGAEGFVTRQLHALSLPEFRKGEDAALFSLDAPAPENAGLPGSPDLRDGADRVSDYRFEDILTFGTLPGVLSCPASMRSELLSSYVSTYLEKDIRAEALTRQLGPFARFLELAALDSGSVPNLSKIAEEAGLPVSSVKNYFEILEDTFLILRVPAFTTSGRKRAFTTPRYFFFDTGFRNAAAGLTLDSNLIRTQGELLFRNFMTVETIRRLSYRAPRPARFSHWSATSGAAVDLVVETGGETIPIVFTSSENPARRDTRHLKTFLKEFGAKRGYLVGRFRERMELENGITALPWDGI